MHVSVLCHPVRNLCLLYYFIWVDVVYRIHPDCFRIFPALWSRITCASHYVDDHSSFVQHRLAVNSLGVRPEGLYTYNLEARDQLS